MTDTEKILEIINIIFSVVSFLIFIISGIGKTQLANEFCYRFCQFFQSFHWIQASEDIKSQIAYCGFQMGF
jgi:hypothetical protein